MQYTASYQSPLGPITLAADGQALTGVWFDGQKYDKSGLDRECQEKDLPVFHQTKRWLDIYFSGQAPDFTPPIRFTGTDFQKEVGAILAAIPYGETWTYGDIARQLGLERMSARAVGGAVGHNRLSILVPCHRVVGTGGRLTGYAGGIDRKIALLKLEGGWKEAFVGPRMAVKG